MANATRRDFLKQAGLGSAAFLLYPPRILGANDRVRIGMIGAGARGQELLKQVLAAPNAELVAIADVYTRRHDEAKLLAPGLQTFTDHRRLLDMKSLDAIIVASPLHIHARHFLDTLSAGKDLYAEKTMTWSIPEAEKCFSAAKASDRVIQIGLQHESSGSLADACKWIKDGIVGKVTQVESWMSRNTPHGQPQWIRPVPLDCTSQNVNWDAFLNGRRARNFDAFKFINWRLFWEFSGGNITENMVHQIAWIMTALDLPLPAAAYMTGGVFSEKDGRQVPDTIAVTFDFPGDIVVTWQSTFSNSRFGLGERLLGSDGTIEHIAGSNDMVTGRSAAGIRYYPEKDNRPHGTPLPGESQGQDHMANWIDCIRSRKIPNAPPEIGYRSALACHMANLSYRRKQRITLDMARSIQPEF
ncbi:MAG TPA: Gfo/Idh/MocA family oxidoreductase [Candidatus Dormibacteraeota bacterium]|nr:Gfo/Idh/MocA family oxidoreductase [Candidatus Dormibacteraeota bacterium]